MGYLDITLDVIGSLAIILTFYFTFKKILWNFNNDLPLRNFSTITSIIIGVVLATSLIFVSLIPKIILFLVLIIPILRFYNYIDLQNRTKNKDNWALQSSYMTEIKKERFKCHIATSLLFVAIILGLLHI
ncbi:MAG: hypothetical protein VB119_03245 [Candidatus Metalachnospira sp.]|nr:hypothetical protein [Candidatus Metalachnospira sp.]